MNFTEKLYPQWKESSETEELFYITDPSGNIILQISFPIGFQNQKAEEHILKGLYHSYICNFQHIKHFIQNCIYIYSQPPLH